MIDIRKLFEKFQNHISTCTSAPFVCNIHASFESWFRVELIPVLCELGYNPDQITTNYSYPHGTKADLCVYSQQGEIVFELKPFVKGQDSNKKVTYPRQIEALEKLINTDGNVSQVITFTTFIGYSERSMNTLMNSFFKSNSWDIIGPSKLIDQYQLYATITSISK